MITEFFHYNFFMVQYIDDDMKNEVYSKNTKMKVK